MSKKLSERQLEGRLMNAVARLLDNRLIVPKIFLETRWPTPNQRADVLAIDRAGAGDIHCVEIKRNLESAYPIMPILKAKPAHYKYVAFFHEGKLPIATHIDEIALYSEDGIGRIGIIVASEDPISRTLTARMVIEPERFRVEKKYYRLIDKFIESHTADLEIRN